MTMPSPTQPADQIIEDWLALRAQARRAGWGLDEGVFLAARYLFLARYAHSHKGPADITVEYNREEYLLVLDEQGQPLPLPERVFGMYAQTIATYPNFARWFKPEADGAGQMRLLAGRWLCHLGGLRHGTVEVFIDPPGLPGFTLVQVRGMGKFEAPGAFDIPCAGHVSGLDAAEYSLGKELGEELNLSAADLDDLRELARYPSSPDSDGSAGQQPRSINHEYRVLYRARLRAEAAAHIRFTDGEVAGLAVFAVDELRALVEHFPERVASGLSGAMDYYLD